MTNGREITSGTLDEGSFDFPDDRLDDLLAAISQDCGYASEAGMFMLYVADLVDDETNILYRDPVDRNSDLISPDDGMDLATYVIDCIDDCGNKQGMIHYQKMISDGDPNTHNSSCAKWEDFFYEEEYKYKHIAFLSEYHLKKINEVIATAHQIKSL